MKKGLGLWAVVLGVAGVLGGCASECEQACQMERECLSAHLDVGACTDSCANRSERSTRYAEQTRACATCMADNACSELLNHCLLDCLGVVGIRRP